MPEPELIAIFGPTAVGKTAVAIELAALLRGRGAQPVAVSADALQVYAGLELLTGVPSPAEQRLLEHRLVSILPLDAQFSAGQYAELAHSEIDGLLAAGQLPIVVGGTGLYLRAALADLELRPPPPPGVRERLMAELQAAGPEALHRMLAQRAPWAAAEISPTDSHRLVRALELSEAGALTQRPQEGSELWTSTTRRPTLLVGLTCLRERLYEQIDRRVEAMLAAGAAEQAQQARRQGVGPTAGKALGFEELLVGDVDGMKRRTRNYARRQLTWMRKLADVNLLDVTDRSAADVAAEIDAIWLRAGATR